MPKSSMDSCTPIWRSAVSVRDRVLDAVHQHALGHFERELRRAACSAAASARPHVRDEVGMRELQARDVHAHAQRVAVADRAPLAHLAARFGEHPVAERHDEAGLLGDGDEGRRLEEAALRMVPADQRLEAHELAVAQRADRLVLEVDLALARARGAARSRAAAARPRARCRLESKSAYCALPLDFALYMAMSASRMIWSEVW